MCKRSAIKTLPKPLSSDKRFGDGRIVGRLPLNWLYQPENLTRLQDGDQDWLKWVLNNPDFKQFRTFRGRV